MAALGGVIALVKGHHHPDEERGNATPWLAATVPVPTHIHIHIHIHIHTYIHVRAACTRVS